MTPERFGVLAHSYGADLKRWPLEERDAAMRLAGSGNARIDAMLAEAAGLDALLDQYQVPPVTQALAARVLATAPEPTTSFWRPGWWSGLSVAGMALSGALAGAIFVSTLLPAPYPAHASDFSYAATIFGGSHTTWSEDE